MKAPFVRNPYNYDTNKASDESGLQCEDKSLAQQHMAADCDINILMERYVVRGEIPQLRVPPIQGDFTNAPTYQEALNLMVEANKSFMALPAKVRSKFDNDPALFVDFCSDSANRDEMRQMGLWSPEATANFQRMEDSKIAQNLADATELASHRQKITPPKGGKGGAD